MKSAFFEKNKILINTITDSPNTSNSNKNKLVDTMKFNKYMGNSEVSSIDFNVSQEIDSIAILNSNLKTFQIKFQNSDSTETTIFSISNSNKRHFFIEFSKQKPDKITISITATHTGAPPAIGYLFSSCKIGDIELFDGKIKVKPNTQSLTNQTADGKIWSTVLSPSATFEIEGKIKTDQNIFTTIYENYVMQGQVVQYIHHYGTPINDFRGIMEQVTFSNNFEFGENYMNNDGFYTGFHTIKGALLPSGGT